MSRYHQRIAANLTNRQRQVLCALEYHHRMTGAHIRTQMQLNAAREDLSSYGVRWPSQSLRVLCDKALVVDEWYATEDGAKAETLYQLTDAGRKVARYCYHDGGVVNAR